MSHFASALMLFEADQRLQPESTLYYRVLHVHGIWWTKCGMSRKLWMTDHDVESLAAGRQCSLSDGRWTNVA